MRGPLVGGGEDHIEGSEALGDVVGLDGAVLRFEPLHDEEGGAVPEGAVRVRGGDCGAMLRANGGDDEGLQVDGGLHPAGVLGVQEVLVGGDARAV